MSPSPPHDPRRPRLVRLGAERLADALLHWAGRDESLDDALELLIEEEDPVTLASALRKRIATLARGNPRFVPYGGSFELARGLRELVSTIHERVLPHDAAAAFALADAFIQTDASVYERIDDSSGIVADAYRDACRLWLEAASRIPEPRDWVALLFERAEKDDYGVREVLLSGAATLLPEAQLRRLVQQFEEVAARADATRQEGGTWIHSSGRAEIMLLARALRDPALNERAVAGYGGMLNSIQLRQVAEFFLECGDADGALARLRQIPESSGVDWHLVARCHAALGQRGPQIDALWRLFEASLSWTAFEMLLALHEPAARDAAQRRAREWALEYDHTAAAVEFLLRGGWPDDAERRAVERAGELKESGYSQLLELVELAHAAGRPRIEVVCYRALLLDVLERARSKAYHHAARYLVRLEELDREVAPGDPLGLHAEFAAGVRGKHGRKSAFWARVEEARRTPGAPAG